MSELLTPMSHTGREMWLAVDIGLVDETAPFDPEVNMFPVIGWCMSGGSRGGGAYQWVPVIATSDGVAVTVETIRQSLPKHLKITTTSLHVGDATDEVDMHTPPSLAQLQKIGE